MEKRRQNAKDATREPATRQHNEILANKTILTLNLKQVARSRRRQDKRQDQPPNNVSLKFKIAFIILTFQWRRDTQTQPMPQPRQACVCQIFILWIGSLHLLISMRAAGPSRTQVPLANEYKSKSGCLAQWLDGWLAAWSAPGRATRIARK